MATENEIDVKSLKRPLLAIIRLRSENKERRDLAGVLTPYYRVTLDPINLSPSQEFIRFGDTHGDELMGFRPTEDIVVEEVIGEYESQPPRIVHQGGPQITLVPSQLTKAAA